MRMTRPSSRPARRWNIARDAHNNAIPVHGRAGVFRRDKDVGLSGGFRDEETVACLVDRQFAGNQIGFGRQDIAVFPDADDLAGAFEIADRAPKGGTLVLFQAELACDIRAIERPIVLAAEQSQNLCAKSASILAHAGEKLLSI